MNIIPHNSALRIGLSQVKTFWKLCKFKSRWRKQNSDNLTVAANIFPIEKVNVGKHTYGELRVYSFGGGREGLSIGSYCSIAGNVSFLLGGEHALDMVSTYPFARHIYSLKDNPDEATKGRIIIDDDVWIGHGVTVLSGVHIGQGAVIGAGSVVTHNVPPYAIFVGNSVKKYRFTDDIINELLKIDYSKLSELQLSDFKEFCTVHVDAQNVSDVVGVLQGRNANVKSIS